MSRRESHPRINGDADAITITSHAPRPTVRIWRREKSAGRYERSERRPVNLKSVLTLLPAVDSAPLLLPPPPVSTRHLETR
jgi:hypothetical protein